MVKSSRAIHTDALESISELIYLIFNKITNQNADFLCLLFHKI
jgi:hypothetical protein